MVLESLPTRPVASGACKQFKSGGCHREGHSAQPSDAIAANRPTIELSRLWLWRPNCAFELHFGVDGRSILRPATSLETRQDPAAPGCAACAKGSTLRAPTGAQALSETADASSGSSAGEACSCRTTPSPATSRTTPRLSALRAAACRARNFHHAQPHVAGRRDADMQGLHSIHGTPSSFSRLCTSFQKSSMSFGAEESKAYHVIRFRR